MINFTKLQGNGNDFILIDEYRGEIIKEVDKPSFALKYCNRNCGIGADGVLFLSGSDKAEIKMRIFNEDGTEAEMCGNGIRCLVKYAFDKGYIQKKSSVETLAGIYNVVSRKGNKTIITVDMGKPLFQREMIPMTGTGDFVGVKLHGHLISAVNTGVPHLVILVDIIDDPNLICRAKELCHNSLFTHGINVNFVVVNKEDEITIRTYERGVERETLSCGTGSVASVVVAHKLGKVRSRVKANTNGGSLIITITNNTALMEGPAERVFEGKLNI